MQLTEVVEQSPSWLMKKFPASYTSRSFITMFTRAFHKSLSWARWIRSAPSHPASLRSIQVIFSHLCLGFPRGFFLSGFPTNTLYAFFVSPMHCIRLTHLIPLYLVRPMMFGAIFCSLPLLPPSDVLMLFSKTVNLCSFLNCEESSLHSYKTRCKLGM